MSVERHYFPGNNTPLGFFSYYKYILSQREANRIICIKGGPGTGKSTFMKRIAEHFSGDEDIDYLHCSADEGSLDGIVLKKRKVALVDGTSPHVTDPITPGAVDKIINLGEYWDNESIEQNRDKIMDLNEETSRWYRIAYNYLSAVKSVYRSIEDIYQSAVEAGEIYALMAEIIEEELGNVPISFSPGKEKKFFASAITGNGVIDYLPTLFKNMKKIYLINSPVGYTNYSFMEILSEGAKYRGLDHEIFYCPICPEEKKEHLIIPQLGLAFITVNEYHDLEPWELAEWMDDEQEIILVDLNDYMRPHIIEKHSNIIDSLMAEYDIFLNKACKYLQKAKETHMKVEQLYIPNMNFTRVGNLIEETVKEIEKFR